MLLVSCMPDAGGVAACGREFQPNAPPPLDSSALTEQSWVCFGHTREAIGLAAS